MRCSPPPAQRRLPLFQTLAYCIGFIVVGICAGLLGPSLSSLAAHTGSTLSAISVIFVASAVGRMIGSLSAGWLLDHTRGHPLMAAGFVLIALALGLIPAARSLPALVGAWLLFGVAINCVDVCTNTLIVRVHGDKVAPYMNTLHLTFGIGASFAPLLVGRSLALSGDVYGAYWLAAALMLPMAIWLLRLRDPVGRERTGEHAEPGLPRRHILIMGLFFFCMVSVEIIGVQWLFNLGLALGMSRETGAPLLASTFWWTYSLGRLIAVPLSLRVRPGLYLALDLAGACLFMALLLVALLMTNGVWLVWVSVIGLGLAIASAFPSALSYIGRRRNLSGAITGVLFASSNLGAMVAPWLIGQLVETQGAVTLPIIGLTLAIAALLMLWLLRRTLR